MLLVCKALLLLVFELIIEYIFGTMLTKWILKKQVHPLLSLLMGFMAYQAVFQVVSLTVTFTTGLLHHISIVWCVIILLFTCSGIVLEHKMMVAQIKRTLLQLGTHKGVAICSMMIVVLFCYYTSINGESNEDARYYIGLMTTSVDTDTLFRYNVYNGYPWESLYLRRALATFEIHSAVLSQITQIHPLVIARVFRACQNVILTSAAVYLCGDMLFVQGEEKKTYHSFEIVSLFWLLQLIFADTIYTPAAFLLYRAYEAKAFTSNLLVLLGLYMCVQCSISKNIRAYVLLIIFLWGCVAISTSALMVVLIECIILLTSMKAKEILLKRKKERLHAR